MGSIRNSFKTLSALRLAGGKARLQQYRLHYLDLSGAVFRADTIKVRDDLDALVQAEAASAAHAVELWHGERLVARIDSDGAPSGRAV